MFSKSVECAYNVTVTGTSNKFGMLSSILNEPLFVYFAIIPLEKVGTHFHPEVK